jgi:hypothetical protein
MIKPTIGRRVWFRVNEATAKARNITVFDDQPLDAGIVYVHSDRMVNLSVTDHFGVQHAVTSVDLIQDGDSTENRGMWCEWMPYQTGQAAKQA